MENLLEKVAGMLGGLWDWTVHLNGGLQIVLVLLAVVMSGVCAIVAKRMQSPMMDMGGSVAGRTAVSIAAYVFGVVFLIVALFGVAAVFAPPNVDEFSSTAASTLLGQIIQPWFYNQLRTEEQLGYAAGRPVVVNFTPHLVPMNRGILATEYATLTKKADGSLPSYEEIKAAYDKYYAKEKFVRVLPKDACPETKWVEGSNYVDIGFKIDERTGRIVMMGALDNLVKGAAGQAVQNMNLLFGFDEAEGLQLVPMFP